MADRRRVVITAERSHSRFEDIFAQDILDDLGRIADVVMNNLERPLTFPELADKASDADVGR